MHLAVASLSIHDNIFTPEYQDEIELWIEKVKTRLDTPTLLIPHKVDSKSGRSIEGARGSSMALMLRILAEIDPEFAAEQYILFKENFVSTTLGLPSVREYPKGTAQTGDIDSGPIVMGVGFAATIVSIGTMPIFGDAYLGDQEYLTVNAFGLELATGSQKKYLFGKVPMADAFIAWSRATDFGIDNNIEINNNDNWRIKFQMISLTILLLIWFPFYKNRFTKKIKTITNR